MVFPSMYALHAHSIFALPFYTQCKSNLTRIGKSYILCGNYALAFIVKGFSVGVQLAGDLIAGCGTIFLKAFQLHGRDVSVGVGHVTYAMERMD